MDMMNARLFAAILMIGLLAGACKRCYQCVVVNEDEEVLWLYKEVCVNQRDFDAYQDICLDAVADSAELSCVCEESLSSN